MKAIIISILITLLGLTSSAQTIDLVGDCSTVKIQSDQLFDQVLSALVFTVSWPSNLSEVSWKTTHNTITVYPTASPVYENERTYITFIAFGFEGLINSKQQLAPGQQTSLVEFTGAAVRMEKSNRLPNTDYFVSLNGVTSTGQIYDHCEGEGIVKLYPNPTDNTLFVSIISGSFTRLLLMDSRGRIVHNVAVNQAKLFELDVSFLAKGSYILRLLGCDKHTQRFVIR